ncbi:MAG: hydroxyphenylacetyl-CoA thioesterase PaaI [Lautropia sp.]
MTDPTAQAVAERVRDAMYAHDAAARTLGIEILAIGPASATLSMRVRDDMLNGHGICHGGLIATLADTAFAYACNACNQQTVAAGFGIDLLAPGRPGDLLTAKAVQQSKAGRSGVFDVEVRDQHDKLIALFRGRSHSRPDTPVVAPARP